MVIETTASLSGKKHGGISDVGIGPLKTERARGEGKTALHLISVLSRSMCPRESGIGIAVAERLTHIKNERERCPFVRTSKRRPMAVHSQIFTE